LEGGVLGERFERLYGASNIKNITVTDRFRLWWGVGGGGRSWRRRLFVWEEERFLEYYIALLVNVILQVGMAMGRGGDEFYLPHPHTLFSHTYPLPYPYPTGMRN